MKPSTALILIVISIGLFFVFTSPEYKKVGMLREQSGQYKNILDNISELAARRDDLLVTYRSIPKARAEELSKVLPDNVDIVKLSMDFDAIGSKYGISIRNIRAAEVKDENTAGIITAPEAVTYGKTTVSISFVATYDNFKRFLRDIEHSLRIVNVRDVSFQSTENGLYQYEMSIETYWLK
jgi:Tfp pilus assembly protein PilO